MSINNLVHNIKTYVAGIHQFMNVGTGSTSISIDQIVVQSNIPIMTIQNGNIGIGTTDTSAGKLVVAGNIVPSACNVYDLGTSNLRWRDLYLSGNTIDLGGTLISRNQEDGGLRVHTADGATSLVNMTLNNIVTSNIVVSGNVGIGTTMSLYALDANGDINFTGILRQSGTPYISSQWTTNSANLYYTTGSVGIGTTLPRSTLDVEGGNAIVSGNVGIGTATPYANLHVVGNILTTGTITASNISVIGDYVTLNTVTSNTEQMVITNAGTGPALKVTQTGIQPIAEFYDQESGLAMTIANNGNIGIGTNAPRYSLDVSGNINFTGSLTSNNAPYLGIGDSIPVGTILPYYSETLTDPSYLICDGATYQRSQYVELANALGVSPSATTFTVPDLRDRFLKGKNADAIGATGGSATTTLSVANLPNHTHTGTTDGGGSHRHTAYAPNHDIDSPASQGYPAANNHQSFRSTDRPREYGINSLAISEAPNHTHTFTTSGTTGATSTPFTNLPPYSVVIYIIKAKNNQYITPVRAGDYWTNVSNQLIYQSGNVGIGTNAPQSLLDVNGNAKVSGTMILNGNVGIGTTTPLRPLHIQGDSIITGTVGIGTTNPTSTLHVNGVITNKGTVIENNITDTYTAITSGNGQFCSIEAYNYNNSIKRPIVIAGYGGNVGIGTTNPLQSLHIRGNNPNMIIQSVNNASFSTIATPGIVFRAANTTVANTTGIFLNEADGLGVWANGAERMRFKWNGYVGIGTTDPSANLHIYANFRIKGSVDSFGRAEISNGYDLYITAGSAQWNFGANGTLYGPGPYYNGSDIKLKVDIIRITDALNKLSQVNGYTFRLKHSNYRNAGLIAQEVQAVLPEAVQTNNDTLYLSYTDVIPLLIESIKEQQTMITELKNEVAQLKQIIKEHFPST